MLKVYGSIPESDTLSMAEDFIANKWWCKVRTWHVLETSHGLCWAQQWDDDKADIATSKNSPKDENPEIWGVLGTLQPSQHDI